MVFKRTALLLSTVAVATFAGITAGSASLIDVGALLTNPSFEATTGLYNCPSGWTCSGSPTPGVGSFTVTSAQFTPGSDGLPGALLTPNGVNAAILPSSGPVTIQTPNGPLQEPLAGNGSGGLQQVLNSVSYTSGNTYFIDFWIGHPIDEPNPDNLSGGPFPVANFPNTLTVSWLIGTTTDNLCGLSGSSTATLTSLTGAASSTTITNQSGGCVFNIPDPGAGLWQEWELTYTPNANPSGNIGIAFNVSASSTGQPRELTLDIGTPPAVPEPATLTLIGAGLAGLGFRRRRSA